MPSNATISDNDREIAADIMGAVTTRPQKIGGYKVDPAELLKPLESVDPPGAIRTFCQGCGILSITTVMGLERMLKLANVSEPDVLDWFYFQADSCIYCDDDFTNVKLLPIKEAQD